MRDRPRLMESSSLSRREDRPRPSPPPSSYLEGLYPREMGPRDATSMSFSNISTSLSSS